MDKPGQRRIILWAAPRTISTAFFRSMMNRRSIKVLLEPYADAYYFGSERISDRYNNNVPIKDNATFLDVKKRCEQPFEGVEEVFIKDMAYYLTGKLHDSSILPRNYTHTFLIRTPYRAVKSLWKLSTDESLTGWNSFIAAEAGFRELLDLFHLVRKETGEIPVVVDADDLLCDPDKVLRGYCEKVGLGFQDSMLSWPTLPTDHEVFDQWMPWFEGALTSQGFLRPTHPSSRQPRKASIELPDEVINCINECQPFYEQMAEYKL